MQKQNQEFRIKEVFESGPFEIIDNSVQKSKNRRSQIKEQQNIKRSISAKPDQLSSKRKIIAENQKSKEDYPQNEIEELQFRLIQMEISDFVIIEHNKNGKEYQVLNGIDWKKIIKQKNYNGFRMMDLHVSLLTQNLFFQERRDLWLFFSQVDKFKAQLNEKKLSFQILQKQKNDFLTQIDKDIPRALQQNEFLKQQENRDSLRKVLTAYANYDPELGYTQGMNIIAANLLICYDLKSNDQALEDVEIIDPQRDEKVFYIFSFIMIEQNWRSVFLPGFPGLIKMLKILKDKFQIELPRLYEHFEEINVDFNICFQQQYLSLLMYGISWEISRMIFDLFLFEGEQIIHTFIIGMLQLCQEQLLKLNQFEKVLNFCRNEMIRQFYQLFSLQLNGKKDLTNTLHNLGIIKVQKEINQQQIVHIEVQPRKVCKMEQIKGAGKFIKNFFTRN